MSCGAQQLLRTHNVFAITQADLAKFEAADKLFPGKSSINAEEVLALDGAPCTPKTRDGLLSAGGTDCHDIGGTTPGPDAGDFLWPLTWLPAPATSARPRAAAAPTALAVKAQAALQRNQFVQSASGCRRDADEPWRSLYYVQTVPLVGFASVLEYLSMFLLRATHMRSQLLLGPRSSVGWTSAWSGLGVGTLTKTLTPTPTPTLARWAGPRRGSAARSARSAATSTSRAAAAG